MNSPDDPESHPTIIARMIGSLRYVMLLAVVAVFIGASLLLLVGVSDMAVAVWQTLSGDIDASTSITLRVAAIDAVDIMLVATVLFVIAFGLYQLFVDPSLRNRLPSWLWVSDIGDLEVRLAGMIIIVLGVIFLTQALESHGDSNLLGFGLAVAAVIIAISLFLYQEGKHHRPGPGDGE